MSTTRVAYAKIIGQATGSYAGGLMVVDSRGLPLDFRYTDPVVPTKIQQVLYGKTLDRHVRLDVIFKHLLTQLDPRQTTLLFVDDDQLLDLASPVPMAHLVETRMPPLKEVSAYQEVASDGAYLVQATETGSPLRFRVAKREDGAVDRVVNVLVECGSRGLDPAEPFARVRSALEHACLPSSDRA